MPELRTSATDASGYVAFVGFADVAAPHRLDPGERLYSSLASTRLRILIPATELARRWPVYIVPFEHILSHGGFGSLGQPRAIVLSKFPIVTLLTREAELRRILELLGSLAADVPVVVDLCDNYAAMAEALNAPFLGTYQHELADRFRLAVPGEAMRRAIAPDARHAVSVIEDPYESEASRPARTQWPERLRLLWFGNLGEPNLGMVMSRLGALAAALADLPLHFTLVAAARDERRAFEICSALIEAHGDVTFGFVPWSVEATRDALAGADIVVLPSETDSPWARVKSHNRLVESIRAGRLAVASPIPAYLEMGEYAWVNDDLAAGVRWALAHCDEVRARIEAGQRYVEQRFAPAVIAGKWARALELEGVGTDSPTV